MRLEPITAAQHNYHSWV